MFLHRVELAKCTSHWLDVNRRFDIHYGGYLFNHLSHNIVVIGCHLSKNEEAADEKMKWWSEVYINHKSGNASLESAKTITSSMPVISLQNWTQHLSREDKFYPAYLRYFDSILTTDDEIDTVVAQHLPVIISGLAGSALHPIIHLGLGLEARHRGMVSEGLACMSCLFHPLGGSSSQEPALFVDTILPPLPPSSLSPPLTLPFPPPPASLLASPSGADVVSDQPFGAAPPGLGVLDALLSWMNEAKAAAYPARCEELCHHFDSVPVGVFQKKIRVFDADGLGLAEALNTQKPLAIPLEDGDLLLALHECTAFAAAAFMASDCDFFVTHALTSLHSLLLCLPHLTQPADQRRAVCYWVRAAKAVVVAQGLPGMDEAVRLLQEWRKRSFEEELHRMARVVLFTDEGEGGTGGGSGVGGVGNKFDLSPRHLSVEEEQWWGQTLGQALTCSDEHVSKSVFALWRWSTMTGLPAASKTLFLQAAEHQIRLAASTTA